MSQSGNWRTLVQKHDGTDWVTQDELSGDHVSQLHAMCNEWKLRWEELRRKGHEISQLLQRHPF